MLKEKLKQYRMAKGWSQTDLAKRSGYSRSSIINWEKGNRAPRTADIEKLAFVLGVQPLNLLLDDVDNTVNNETQTEAWLLPKDLGEKKIGDFAYWGGVLDTATNLADSKNLQQIQIVAPLLKIAYEMLTDVLEQEKTNSKMSSKETPKNAKATPTTVSAYNGDNSSYKGNSLTINEATA